MKRVIATVLIALTVMLITVGCGSSTAEPETKPQPVTDLPKPDTAKWQYNGEFDIYYQIGISYCEKPADEKYEQLAIFVPGAYMEATDNADGSYTCKPNESAKLNGYTALDAPIIMPIETPAYLSARPLTEEVLTARQSIFEQLSDYTLQGYVFIYTGCRGISEGAPAGVTDLKAAIRYIRYADDAVPGDAESIFVYGMSGGGAQAAILGASGDSELYDPYLEAIGSVQGVSDAVKGAVAWCPVTSLGTANAEYEWMMGCTRKGRTKEEQEISDGLAAAFADYVNKAGFVDKSGKPLTLAESKEGIYQAGSYYDHVKGVIETSLDHYLADMNLTAGSAQDYIDGLNTDKKWVTYDKSTNTASITSTADFAEHCKRATDLIVAFDQPNSNNMLFGYGDGNGSHFDRILAGVLTNMNSEYAAQYNDDLAKTDSFGYSVEKRVNMYSPLYYLMKSEDGYGSAKAAPYWRIRSGINQQTNSLTTEINLALALEEYDDVESLDFETVWEQGHTEAERTGSHTENFIAWVDSCMKNQTF